MSSTFKKPTGEVSIQSRDGEAVGVTDNALNVAITGGNVTIDNATFVVQTDAFNGTPDSELMVGSEDGTELGTRHVAKVKADGTLLVDGSATTQPVSGPLTDTELRASAVPISAASLPLPAGASTEAKQDTGNTSLGSIDTKLSSQATAAKQDTGNTSLSSIDTKLSSQATAANQATANTTLSSLLTELQQKTEPADTQTISGSVSVSNFPAVQPVSDNAGSLTVDDGGSSLTVDGTIAATQSGSWTVSSVGTVGAILDPVAVTDNGGSLTVDGTVAATQSGSWNITNISGTVSLPTGAATGTKQDTGNTSLASIDTKLSSQATAANQSTANTTLSSLLTELQQKTEPADTQTVAGTVAVSNFPSVQPVSDNGGSLTIDGSVSVSNLPAVQPVSDNSGSLTIDDGGGSITVDGTISVDSLDVIQTSGTITNVGDSVSLNFSDKSLATALIRVSGKTSNSAQPEFQVSINGTDWIPHFGLSLLAQDGQLYATPAVASDDGNGIYQFNVVGFKAIRAIAVPPTFDEPVDILISAGTGESVFTGFTSYMFVKQSGADTWVSGGTYNATPPTLTDGDRTSLQLDSAGKLLVSATFSGGATETTLAAIDAKLVSGNDIGDVTINNSTGAAAVNIQDGGNSITVDGTVTVQDGGNVISVDDGAGSLTIDNAALSVVGGGTEATALRVTIASDSTGVLSVDDNGGNLSIDDGGNSITVDNAGTFAVQATIAAAATNIAKAEDAASADADVGVPAMAILKATPADTAGTDGDYQMLQMSAGRLWASAKIDTALPAGSNAIGKLAANDGVDIGDVTINNTSLAVTNGTAANLKAEVVGTGTFAVQATVAAGAANIAKAEDVGAADGDVGVPAMAVRKATPANTSGTDGDYEMLQMSAGRLWTSTVVDTALPAGTNAIGKLAANSGVDIGDVDITSIAAGDNNIGNVDVVTLPNVTMNSSPIYFYNIVSQVHVASANTVHWDFFNADAALIVRVLSIRQIPNITTAVTGIVFDWKLARTTSVGTAGSAQTAWLADTNDTALDADITCRSKPTGGAAESTILSNYSLSSEETNAATIQIASEGGLELVPEALQYLNNRRGIVLRQNQGLRCVQITSSNAGNTGWLIAFTVE